MLVGARECEEVSAGDWRRAGGEDPEQGSIGRTHLNQQVARALACDLAAGVLRLGVGELVLEVRDADLGDKVLVVDVVLDVLDDLRSRPLVVGAGRLERDAEVVTGRAECVDFQALEFVLGDPGMREGMGSAIRPPRMRDARGDAREAGRRSGSRG